MMIRTELTPAEQGSIERVIDTLEIERERFAGGPLAVLWLDWASALYELADGERTVAVA